ncbi:MAG: dihydropteroate synthase [Candidatus Omnitrophica bacterium]|nr:dihydropteroate synthase [Candidatus Omnitrophota bacterium]
MIWTIRDREIRLEKTLLMGIVNITPDSFSDGGEFFNREKAIARAFQIESEGADILDLGAESTRPHAGPVPREEELGRILPVLRGIRKRIRIPISVDTTKPEVARLCLQEGAHIVNDVSGLKLSGPAMAETVREFRAGLILVHRRGTPQTMQLLTDYEHGVEDVLNELKVSLESALAFGIDSNQLVIDPGLGFAKTAEQNIAILSELEKFHRFERPVLLGPSRKSFIGKVTGKVVDDREFGTAAVVTYAVFKRVQILRVHNVHAMRDAVRMAEAIRETKGINYVGAFQMGEH